MTPTRPQSITEADRSVLGPLAEHRILIVPQVAVLLGISEGAATRRLQRLHSAGLVRYQRMFHGLPAHARITSRGLDAIEHTHRAPNENLREYRHDVGVGWLWLAAGSGAFGEVTHIASDRGMRARDASEDRSDTYGVGLGMLGSHGRPQRHYPDLMLDLTSGHRVAVELELTQKSARRMSRIMTAYASDARIDAVLYLVPNQRLATIVTDAARRAGIADIVHVQRLAPDAIAGAPAGASERGPARTAIPRGAQR
jgi:hypothetical protein